MEKGNYGITLRTYGILAFLFAIVGWSTGLLLLAGVVIFLEKEEKSGVTVITALLLSVFSDIVYVGLGFLSFVDRTLYNYNNVLLSYGVISLLQTLARIVFVVFIIIGLTQAATFKIPEIPLATEMARKAYGKIAPSPMNYQQQPYQQQGAPYAQQSYQQSTTPPYGAQYQQQPYQAQSVYPPQNPPTGNGQ